MFNTLILFNLIFLAYANVIFADQLYHREGRFIDLSVHRYKTQLPSIHDIANSFIHYRMPVAVLVPTVRLNIRPKQKRTHFSNFPAAKKAQENQSEPQNKIPVVHEQETQIKLNNKPELTQPIISRTGWSARSLSKPKSFNSLSQLKLRSMEQAYRRSNLNYASVSPSESNVDLIPFLYKDNLPGQTSNLFNTQYQLTNSNPSHMFSQNIAYIQPNSLAPFQPNILLLTAPERSIPDQMKNENQSLAIEKQKNSTTINANSTLTITQTDQSINRPVDQNKVESSNSTSFDVNQVSDNPDEIVQEHVQNHEPIENVPTNPVNSVEESSGSVDNVSANSTINNDGLINNSTTLILNSQSNEKTDKQLDNQPINQPVAQPIIGQPIELRNGEIVNELTLADPSFYRSNRLNRSNLVNQLYSPPALISMRDTIKPKNTITNRTHRSLSIDMPSFASLITAAVAQSGHSSENRKIMFARFLDDNSN